MDAICDFHTALLRYGKVSNSVKNSCHALSICYLSFEFVQWTQEENQVYGFGQFENVILRFFGVWPPFSSTLLLLQLQKVDILLVKTDIPRHLRICTENLLQGTLRTYKSSGITRRNSNRFVSQTRVKNFEFMNSC